MKALVLEVIVEERRQNENSAILPELPELILQIMLCFQSKHTFNTEWNMEENFRMEWNREQKICSMGWKKIASVKCGKIVFHTMPCIYL